MTHARYLPLLLILLTACNGGSLEEAEDIDIFDSTDMRETSQEMRRNHILNDMRTIYAVSIDSLERKLLAEECDTLTFPPLTGAPWEEDVTGEWFMATGDSLHIRIVEDKADALVSCLCTTDNIPTETTATIKLHREPDGWKIYRVHFGGRDGRSGRDGRH